jgi:hypothetical protein
MPVLESHLADISREIQLAVAPVFLLTAIATIINALTGRLARAIDRRRLLEELLPDVDAHRREDMGLELSTLSRRVVLVTWSIALAVLAALFVCLLIGTAFVGTFIALDLAHTVAGLFIAAVASLTICLVLFMREVFLAAIVAHRAVRR